jgi:branched-chain amino acid transport system ATP-binding protein
MLLEVRALDVTYGTTRAVRGLDLTVETGEIVTVLGANGAGKSSLLRAVQGLVRPASGSILFNGEPVAGSSAANRVSRGLVLVPEGRQVFPFLSVRDNLGMGAYTRRDGGVAADLERVYQWFPRLRERQAQPAGLLSGGEQQMLAIGRALMAKPRLLMLDEPSLGLSPLLTKEIFQIIRRIRDETGTSILVVEQNAAIALAHADDGYIMELGRIVAADSCQALAQKADVRQSYLGGGHATGLSGTAQRWKQRKTWR